jgi:hypothetical protein
MMQARFPVTLARFERVKEDKKRRTDGQDRASNLNPTDETSHGLRGRGSLRLYFDGYTQLLNRNLLGFVSRLCMVTSREILLSAGNRIFWATR